MLYLNKDYQSTKAIKNDRQMQNVTYVRWLWHRVGIQQTKNGKKYTAKMTGNEFPHRVCVFTWTHMWQSEDNLRESTPSFHHVGLGTQTQVVRWRCRCFYSLRHFISPGNSLKILHAQSKLKKTYKTPM